MIYVQLHHFNGEIVIYEIYLNKNNKNKVRKKGVINQIYSVKFLVEIGRYFNVCYYYYPMFVSLAP